MQPTLPLLYRLLAAADLEHRTRLLTYDAHDDALAVRDPATQVELESTRGHTLIALDQSKPGQGGPSAARDNSVSAEMPGPDVPAIPAIFDRHQVGYVVVGGCAANLHGSTRVITDFDLTPNRTHTNLARVAAALRGLEGGIRVDDFDLDLTFEPGSTDGYPDLIRHAEDHAIGTLQVHVACPADVIRSKTPAGRPTDLQALPSSSGFRGASRRNLED